MRTMGPRKIGSLSNIHQRYSSRRDKQATDSTVLHTTSSIN